jgi:hypothetical protein
MTESELRYEIHDAKRPVQALWEWKDNSGAHVVLIIGVYPTGELEIIDPLCGQGRFTFTEVQTANSRGKWTYSYFKFNQA